MQGKLRWKIALKIYQKWSYLCSLCSAYYLTGFVLVFVVVIVALLVFLSLKSEVHPELLVDGTLKSKN